MLEKNPYIHNFTWIVLCGIFYHFVMIYSIMNAIHEQSTALNIYKRILKFDIIKQYFLLVLVNIGNILESFFII